MNSKMKSLSKKLLRDEKLVWDVLTQKEKTDTFKLCDEYKEFLDFGKTERKACEFIFQKAKKENFQDIEKVKNLKVGDKVFRVFNNKTIALAVIGKDSLKNGCNIVASHLDSPRLDLKQNPLYEDTSLSMLKTHYYGGIRKYHWLARPLAIYGTVVKKDGSLIDIEIGEKESDPVFVISDLLPHLARKSQADKKLADVFEAEKLNIIVGSIPIDNDTELKDRFKLSVLNFLFEKYKLVEEDFVSAEIEVVPAGRARDIGFDEGLVGAYGQDDRICSFASYKSIFDCDKKNLKKTAVSIFFDKEEIGSDGNTGAKSKIMEEFVSDLLYLSNSKSVSDRDLRKLFFSSSALSADVNGGLDPDYKEVHEKMNAAKLGYGVCITKFTGSGGKSMSNDANAEYVGKLRKLFNDNKVVWQTGELGKVDEGGGGTIAKYIASYGLETIDCGTAVLSMHSPFEISSKADVYMTYKAYKSFFDKF